MCISHSVGLNAANNPADVKLVQVLLNENLHRMQSAAPLVVDGSPGPVTIGRLAEFQEYVLQAKKPSRCVVPGDQTLRQLRLGLGAGLTSGKLQGIMLAAAAGSIDRYYQPLMTMTANRQIDTSLRMAHFLAQVGHESGDLRYCEELADGSAYEGRIDLGNTQPGDGPRFKGRGLIQLTGRANYAAFGQDRGKDFVTPENYRAIATDPTLAVDVACWYWVRNGLNALADADNLAAITLKINGGYNGLPSRAAHLQLAKCLLLSVV